MIVVRLVRGQNMIGVRRIGLLERRERTRMSTGLELR